MGDGDIKSQSSLQIKEDILNGTEDRRSSKTRWLILILCCLSTFGDYYCIDNVGVLHDALKTQFEGKLNDSFDYYFGLLYSLYSLPNIILPFIGGLLVMKFGVRSMYMVFGAFIMAGQLIFAIGCSNTNIATMLVGRIIFGFGGESLNICQNAMIVKWFYKSEIALPLGLTISVSRLGSVLNDVASPRLVTKEFNASPALWTGFGVCVFSFACSILLNIIDYNKEKNMREHEVLSEEEEMNLCDSISSIKDLGKMFWLITLLCLTLYGAVLPFNYIASGFLTDTYFKDMNKIEAQNKAGIYMSVPFFISAFMVPLYGILIDKYGQRAYLSLLASIVGLICFTMFYYCPPLLSLIILGLTYSMFASVIWPAISLVVKKSLVGFAYGVTTSVQNAGLAVFPLIVAGIYSKSKSYYTTLSFFIILCVISIGLACILITENNNNYDNIINKTKFDEDEEVDDQIDPEKYDEHRKLCEERCSSDTKISSTEGKSTNYQSI